MTTTAMIIAISSIIYGELVTHGSVNSEWPVGDFHLIDLIDLRICELECFYISAKGDVVVEWLEHSGRFRVQDGLCAGFLKNKDSSLFGQQGMGIWFFLRAGNVKVVHKKKWHPTHLSYTVVGTVDSLPATYPHRH